MVKLFSWELIVCPVVATLTGLIGELLYGSIFVL